MTYRLNLMDRQFLQLAIRQRSIGLSDVRAFYRCSDLRARFILSLHCKNGYLQPVSSGGFTTTNKAETEMNER